VGQLRFTDEEMRRYSRQMILREVGGLGQARLRRATASARSELEALYLAGAGVGTLEVPSEAVAEAARALNPLVTVVVRDLPSIVASGAATGEEAAASALRTVKEILGL
jgi:molybdopterin/thiamine biosynthesis adenylyltransferase